MYLADASGNLGWAALLAPMIMQAAQTNKNTGAAATPTPMPGATGGGGGGFDWMSMIKMFGGGGSQTTPPPMPIQMPTSAGTPGVPTGVANAAPRTMTAIGPRVRPKTVWCPEGFAPDPTWAAIPASERGAAAAAGLRACMPLNRPATPAAAPLVPAPTIPIDPATGLPPVTAAGQVRAASHGRAKRSSRAALRKQKRKLQGLFGLGAATTAAGSWLKPLGIGLMVTGATVGAYHLLRRNRR